MVKTRDLFKKIRDTKGTFHSKMGTIKERNASNRSRWYQEEEARIHRRIILKDLHIPDNHNGVITHLESGILESKVKCGLGSITTNKVSEVMEFQLSYFKSWKMMLWKCCTQYASTLENSAVATGQEKVSFHSNSKERQCQRMFKLSPNCTHLTRAKHCSKFSR